MYFREGNRTCNRCFFTLLTLLTANVCLANDALIPSQRIEAPQPVRRVHYLNPDFAHPASVHPISPVETAPVPVTPVPIPIRVAAVQSEAVSRQVPPSFTLDTGSDSPTAWTLDDAISATLMSDPALHIGREEINLAKAEWIARSLIPNPSLGIAGDAIPFRRRDAHMESEFTVHVEVPLDWFLFAKRAAEMNSARWDVRQSQAEYADLVRQRIAETATAFYDVLETKALLSLAGQNMEILASVEAVTQRAVAAGGVPSVELDRIRLELFRNRQELLEIESQLNIAKAKLWAQFGRTRRDPAFDIRGSLDAPLTVQPYPIEEAFDLAQKNRPDIRALRIQVNKAQANREVERRNAYPEVSFSGGYIREHLDTGSEPGWGIGLTVAIPLFDRNQGGRARAQAVLRQSHYELHSGIVELRAEVEEADQLFRTAYLIAATFAHEEVLLASRVRNSTIQSYEAGGSPLIDVLDAERTYRETYRTYISSRADYWRAKYVYNSVIGQ